MMAAERFVKQYLANDTLEREIEYQKDGLSRIAMDRKAVHERMSREEVLHARFDVVRQRIEVQRLHVLERSRRVDEREANVRSELSQRVAREGIELGAQLEALEDRIETLTKEGEVLRRQREVVVEFIGKSGDDSAIRERLAKRRSDIAEVRREIESQRVRAKELATSIEPWEKEVRKAEIENATLRAVVAECTTKFDAMQKRLSATHDVFVKAKDEKEKLERKLQRAINEVAAARAQVVGSQKSLSTETATLERLQKQLSTIEAQSTTLQGLVTALRQKRAAHVDPTAKK